MTPEAMQAKIAQITRDTQSLTQKSKQLRHRAEALTDDSRTPELLLQLAYALLEQTKLTTQQRNLLGMRTRRFPKRRDVSRKALHNTHEPRKQIRILLRRILHDIQKPEQQLAQLRKSFMEFSKRLDRIAQNSSESFSIINERLELLTSNKNHETSSPVDNEIGQSKSTGEETPASRNGA